MTTDPLTAINTRATPQSEKAREDQVQNAAGGYAFKASTDTRLKRFLTIGTDGGTYYTSERDLTRANAEVVVKAAQNRPVELVDLAREMSVSGRAPRNTPALFALAAAAKLGQEVGGRQHAYATLPDVARTGYHLYKWLAYADQFGGWSRAKRRAVAKWFQDRPAEALAYQMIKYRQREGWSGRDALRLSHPRPIDEAHGDIYGWMTQGNLGEDLPAQIRSFMLIQSYASTDDNAKAIARLVADHRLPWEAIPDWALSKPIVWESLIDNGMPMTALMRQLPRLTRIGVIKPMSERTSKIAEQLTDGERLRKARVHPINILVALRTYAAGRNMRGSGTWEPVPVIVDALDEAFYAAFDHVKPTGKRIMVACDVSGSMGGMAGGMPITCAEVTGAYSLVTASTEPNHVLTSFSASGHQAWRSPGRDRYSRWSYGHGDGISTLPISPRQRMDDVLKHMLDRNFGGTDCALPMLYALDKGLEIDAFQIITDNETWYGSVHPYQALRKYREQTGIDAKLIVVGITANDVTIADPDDLGTLDIAGFDSAVPNLMADFIR